MESSNEDSLACQTSGARVNPREKTFECSFGDCKKRFTRAEHLQRHALNHAPGPGHVCSQCRAHFKRLDLLNRHMERHRQKDLEAGGPGRGVLDTRKRSWIDRDGTVKGERPNDKSTSRPRKAVRNTKSNNQRHLTPEENQDCPETEISTDPSDDTNYTTTFEIEPGEVRCIARGLDWTNSQGFGVVEDIDGFDISDYNYEQEDITALGTFKTYDWKDQAAVGFPTRQYNEVDYEQLFQPDTASSFNMPYTTGLDYSWLFKSNPTLQSMNIQQETGQNLAQETQFALSPISSNSSQVWTMTSNPASSDSGTSSEQRDIQANLQMTTCNERTSARSANASHYSRNAHSTSRAPSQRHNADLDVISSPERPFSTLDGSLRVPRLDEATWRKVLGVIESANPCLPDTADCLWQHSLLSLDSLQNYLELFFSRFNTAYSLIHLPTFDPHTVEPLLLLAVLLLGATYSDKDAHQLAVCIHDVIRPSIFAHAGFSAQPKLWNLQTILLVECFGKSRAGLKQHEMSHLFHGLLINLIRRSDCQAVKPTGPLSGSSHQSSYEKTWQQWAIAEQKKRLALFCFMWDTQHAVLFCQSLCMSSFELRVDLPCPQNIWEAQDSSTWASAWRCTPTEFLGTPYLVALKSYLSPSTPRPRAMDSVARVLLLHGLMSVAWDMQRRDQTALGLENISNNSYQGWKRMIKIAYDTWQSDFKTHCSSVIRQLREKTANEPTSQRAANKEICQQVSVFASCYIGLADCAQILLHMDFLDVQIYAGARHILGRPVQQKDYVRSAEVVKRWAATEASASSSSTSRDANSRASRLSVASPSTEGLPQGSILAVTHAAQVLHEHIDNLTDQDAMSLFHVPWCLYLSTLTLWAYHHARPLGTNTTQGDLDSSDWDEIVWDPHGEMRLLVAKMVNRENNTDSSLPRCRTNGLVWVMAEALTKVRWGIVHAGVSVLKGLVPQRLINRYDDPID